MTRVLPARSALAAHWMLDPEVVFLNHGSFGATPRTVLDAQSRIRARLESEPVRFMVRELEPLMDASREALARVVGADPSRLVFVQNATTGVNTVLRSLALRPGDELLTTNHEYNACKNALDFVAHAAGATVVVADIAVPVRSEADVVDAIVARVSSRTRLLLVDHVTSPTGLVLPIEAIVRKVQALGVDVLVDGAHAPGMVPLDLEALGAAYYTGNCHKWLCTPKGAALLHVRSDRVDSLRPLVISHGANSTRTDRSRLLVEFDWTGTSDPTAIVAVADAIHFLEGLVDGGLARVMADNRALALEARALLERSVGANSLSPESMIGSLAAVMLPDRLATEGETTHGGDPLQDRLFDRHAIEVPVPPWPSPPQRLVRVAAQRYNAIAEYTYLAEALREELPRG